MTDWPRSTYQLPDPPLNEQLASQTWTSYRTALEELARQPGGIERLNGLLIEVSAAIEKQQRDVISQALLAYHSKADQPVIRSMPRVARSPDRPGRAPAQSQQPAPWELLSASRRLGPRLAQKLTIAEARRQAKNR